MAMIKILYLLDDTFLWYLKKHERILTKTYLNLSEYCCDDRISSEREWCMVPFFFSHMHPRLLRSHHVDSSSSCCVISNI